MFTDMRDIIFKISLVIFGTALLAFGTGVFLVPFDLVTGGISGLSIVLSELSGISEEAYIAILSWSFFIAGSVLFGRSFFYKTAISTVLYPPLTLIFSRLASPDVLGGYFAIGDGSTPEIALITAALFGGALVGAGCALTFVGGGSTGGIDIVALALKRRFARVDLSHVFFAIDAVIVTLGAFAVKNFILTSLGILSAFVCSFTLKRVLFVKKL